MNKEIKENETKQKVRIVSIEKFDTKVTIIKPNKNQEYGRKDDKSNIKNNKNSVIDNMNIRSTDIVNKGNNCNNNLVKSMKSTQLNTKKIMNAVKQSNIVNNSKNNCTTEKKFNGQKPIIQQSRKKMNNGSQGIEKFKMSKQRNDEQQKLELRKKKSVSMINQWNAKQQNEKDKAKVCDKSLQNLKQHYKSDERVNKCNLDIPEYNSIYCTIFKMNEIMKEIVAKDVKSLPPTVRQNIIKKVSSSVNYSSNETVYKDLPKLSFNEKDLLNFGKSKKNPTKTAKFYSSAKIVNKKAERIQ